MALSIHYQGNGSFHKDIVLSLGERVYVVDSYWLSEDQVVMPNRDDSEKVRAVLVRLIEQWLDAIERVPDNGTVYLPFDFSDEYTACLSCHRRAEGVVVTPCWSKSAWRYTPSALGDLSQCPADLETDGPAARFVLESLLSDIRASLALARM